MFCSKCGTQILENSVICPNCGTAVKNNQEVNSNLALAIISTICCCIPFGIVSIVYACKVNTLLAAGDKMGAIAAADKAKKWAFGAIISGIILNLIIAFIQFIAAASASV